MLDLPWAALQRRHGPLPAPRAAEAYQVDGEDVYDGHLVMRLLVALVLLYTARLLCKGRVTMEGIVFSLKHHRRLLNSELVELDALSWDLSLEAA
jgi:hypothetical protein